MLKNGLGELLSNELISARRFVDLFAGSGAVAIHVSQKYSIPVLAFDLQKYGVVLTGAVITRERKLDWNTIWNSWYKRARVVRNRKRVPSAVQLTQCLVQSCRRWCAKQTNAPVTRAYGGHYFSPLQAVWIDSLRRSIPKNHSERTVALAALIQAASQCAAAPGHTAQPFQPTRTSKRYLKELWSRNIVSRTKNIFAVLADQSAIQKGRVRVADANVAALELKKGDLAFIDPPYSGVHYSRFYHVLETVASGECGNVSGVGRYPAREQRPQSRYSLKSKSTEALDDLLKTVAARGARAIFTFPDQRCSNGLSGKDIREIAARHFRIREDIVDSKFSTLGGTGDKRDDEAGRAARRETKELMLVLEPRGQRKARSSTKNRPASLT